MNKKILFFLIPLFVAAGFGSCQADVRVPFEPEEGSLERLRVLIDPTDETSILTAGHLRHYLRGAGAREFLTHREDRRIASQRKKAVQQSLAFNPHFSLSITHSGHIDGLSVRAEMKDGEKNRKMLEGMRETFLEGMGKVLKEEASKSSEKLKSGSDSTAPVLEVTFGTMEDSAKESRTAREAEALYWGILEVWKKYGDRLQKSATPSEEFLAEQESRRIRHSWRRDPASQVAANVWPFDTAPKDAEQAQWLLNQYKAGLTDPTFFYVQTEIEKKGREWVLTGATNNAQIQALIGELLLKVGCKPLQNNMRLLPSENMGEKLYGLCRTATAFTWGEPREGGRVQTQLLLGERLLLLDESPDKKFLLVHGGDGYLGWVREDSVMRLKKQEFSYWETTPAVVVKEDLKVSGIRVPGGAWLPLVSESEGGSVVVRIPEPDLEKQGHRDIELPMEKINLPDKPSAGEKAIETAMQYLGVPYVFGGKSRLGIDCSGLTGIGYMTVGMNLPRDAKQQVLVGQLVGTPWHMDNLQAGDLIFFARETGRVSHTGLSLGGKKFIHASAPEVQISSFDPEDKTYSERLLEEFVFARRPMP